MAQALDRFSPLPLNPMLTVLSFAPQETHTMALVSRAFCTAVRSGQVREWEQAAILRGKATYDDPKCPAAQDGTELYQRFLSLEPRVTALDQGTGDWPSHERLSVCVDRLSHLALRADARADDGQARRTLLSQHISFLNRQLDLQPAPHNLPKQIWGAMRTFTQADAIIEKLRAITPDGPPAPNLVSYSLSRLFAYEKEQRAAAEAMKNFRAIRAFRALQTEYQTSHPIMRAVAVQKIVEDSAIEIERAYDAFWFGRAEPGLPPVAGEGVLNALNGLGIFIPPDSAPKNASQIREWLNDPANEDSIKKISSLNLSGLNLTHLPKEISKFTGLYTLNLGNNLLSALPPELEELSLFYLDLSLNKFTKIPEIRKPAYLVNFLSNPMPVISEEDYNRWNSWLNAVLPLDIFYLGADVKQIPLAPFVREMCKAPAYLLTAIAFIVAALFACVWACTIELVLQFMPNCIKTIGDGIFLGTLALVALVFATAIVPWCMLSSYVLTPLALSIAECFGVKRVVQL